MDRIQMHKELCQKLNETYEKKNSDYGNSFGDTFDKLGVISAITRISDKYNRLVSLCTKSEEERKVKDESITDTLLDMANYCIMTVIELHKDDVKPGTATGFHSVASGNMTDETVKASADTNADCRRRIGIRF